jgi:hypothetical protein
MDSNRQMEEEKNKTRKQVDESVVLNVANSAGDLNHRRSAAQEGRILLQLLRQQVISILSPRLFPIQNFTASFFTSFANSFHSNS